MSCKAFRLKLSAYLDGELPGFEMLDVRAHLSECKECSQEALELRALKKILAGMTESDPREDSRAELEKAVFAAARPRVRPLSVAMISCIVFATAMLISLAGLHTQSGAPVARPVVPKADQNAFDVSRDQAYQAGGDVFNDGAFIITASAPSNGLR